MTEMGQERIRDLADRYLTRHKRKVFLHMLFMIIDDELDFAAYDATAKSEPVGGAGFKRESLPLVTSEGRPQIKGALNLHAQFKALSIV
jgi:hypothetical protein